MRLRQTQTNRADSALNKATATGLSCHPQSVARGTEGDDLNRARLFTLKATSEMSDIIKADRTEVQIGPRSKGRDPVWLCERLTIIQREAKRARARAVYRSVQDVLNLVQRCNAHMPIDWTRVDGRLFVLNKLLGQYETGLSELEFSEADHQDISADATPQSTLTRLLPHASEDERAALTRLMTCHETAKPATPSDDLETEKTERDDPAQDVLVVAPAPVKADHIEWVMADLVQSLLEVGRQYGKIFSVSHSLDEATVEAGSSERVSHRLFERLSDLVASNLPLQGVGRVDIALSGEDLVISGSGFETFLFPLPERVEDAAINISALTEISNNPIDDAQTVSVQPRITSDTEGDLRAQLEALMDGGRHCVEAQSSATDPVSGSSS